MLIHHAGIHAGNDWGPIQCMYCGLGCQLTVKLYSICCSLAHNVLAVLIYSITLAYFVGPVLAQSPINALSHFVAFRKASNYRHLVNGSFKGKGLNVLYPVFGGTLRVVKFNLYHDM